MTRRPNEVAQLARVAVDAHRVIRHVSHLDEIRLRKGLQRLILTRSFFILLLVAEDFLIIPSRQLTLPFSTFYHAVLDE